MMKAKATHQNKFMKILAMPIRALAKARDFYVRSMNNYADKLNYGAAAPGWGSAPYSVPRSFSTTSMRSSNDEDYKELVRAASTSTLGKRLDLTSALSAAGNSTAPSLPPPRKEVPPPVKGVRGVPRSASVGMAKIEEDKPCEFSDDQAEVNNGGRVGANNKDGQKNKDHQKFRLFPRSRSHGIGTTKRSI